MNILRDGETLSVSGLSELDAASCRLFKSILKAALPANIRRINIDLSRTRVDSGGVEGLDALPKCARNKQGNVAIHILNPTLATQRLFTLTRMDRLFPIEQR